MLQLAALQILQVLTVLILAPLLPGFINRAKAIVQSRHGPSIFQPYFDLWKLLHKGSVISEHASWIFRTAPLLAFITPLIVAMLIPVLTGFPLPYAFMGDMLAGGFILSLGGFFTAVAALDTGSAFGGMGSSRSRVVGALAGSPGSIPAFRKALQLAHDYHGTLHVLSVEESVPHHAASQREAGAEETEVVSYFRNLHWRVRKDAEAVGVETSTRIVRGHAARSIAEAASEMGADLIVLGHPGHPGVVERLLGSTSDRVLDTAPCSVLVVRDKTGKEHNA